MEKTNDKSVYIICVAAIIALILGAAMIFVGVKVANQNKQIEAQEAEIAQLKSQKQAQTDEDGLATIEYDACFVASAKHSIYVTRGGSGYYVSKLYVKNNVCWYEIEDTNQTGVALLSQVNIMIYE